MTISAAIRDEAQAKAFDSFLSTMKRQMPGEVTTLAGGGITRNIPSISTGAISLDVALGVGGLPRGRIIELWGPESSGKCLTADTYLWTDHGLETIEELFGRLGQKASNTTRVTELPEGAAALVNERDELEGIAALTHNYTKSVLNITLSGGRSIEATYNHPLRVMGPDGFIVWRKAGNIQAGDTIVSALFGANTAKGASDLDESTAIVLGYLTAEGGMSEGHRFGFTNWDLEVQEDYKNHLRAAFGVETTTWDDKTLYVLGKTLRQRLVDEFGMDVVRSAGKSIPYVVRTAGPKVQAAYLSALYEGDGWIDKGSEIGLASASKTLASQLQLMLLGFGIPASLNAKWNPTYERNYWNVLVGPAAAGRFLDLIGFRSQRRAGQVEENYSESPQTPQFESIPHLADLLSALRDDLGGDRQFDDLFHDLTRPGHTSCSQRRLGMILDWATDKPVTGTSAAIVAYLRHLHASNYTYETVRSIEDVGQKPTFDVVMPHTHSFVANGILSHNTSLALSTAANAMREGGAVGFVDAEHALSLSHATAHGVDPERLVVFQPNSGEQGLQMAQKMCESGAFDIVIVDSVAALVPQAEIDGEIGDQHVGLQARMMSQAMRKLSGVASRTNTMMIFINQIREKIGGYGNPEDTPGGRALKFYASVRMEVRSPAGNRIKMKVGGVETPIGQTCKVTVRKNKVSVPFKTAEYDLYYESGIQSAASIFDAAVATGAITKASSVTYVEAATGEQITTGGAPGAKARIAEDVDLQERLKAAILATLQPVEPDFEGAATVDVDADTELDELADVLAETIDEYEVA